jgi:hypothetical protein
VQTVGGTAAFFSVQRRLFRRTVRLAKSQAIAMLFSPVDQNGHHHGNPHIMLLALLVTISTAAARTGADWRRLSTV